MIDNFDDLISFLRRFHNYTDPANDARVPSEFPPVLAKFYSEFGSLIEPSPENGFRTPFDNQDRFECFEKIEISDGLIKFASENQGSWTCACSLDETDDKVYGESYCDPSLTGFQPIGSSLTEFITSLALQESAHSGRGSVSFYSPELFDVAKSSMQALWHHSGVWGEAYTFDFYYDPTLDVLMDCRSRIFASNETTRAGICRWLDKLTMPKITANTVAGLDERLIIMNKYCAYASAVQEQDQKSMIEIVSLAGCDEERAREIVEYTLTSREE